eukprot:m.270598 g.270598  ORF g.270598 m.270598 type:complete len:631 (-) comp16265_c1_seq10:1597-3489(-)
MVMLADMDDMVGLADLFGSDDCSTEKKPGSQRQPNRRAKTKKIRNGSCGECDEKDLEENLTEVRLSSNSLQSKVAKLTSAATSLPPEPQTGGIEYKLKLVNPSQSRFEQLVTQMKWRLAEGGGKATYEIGVSDDGTLSGLSSQDLEASLATLSRMAAANDAYTKVDKSLQTGDGKVVAEVSVQRAATAMHCPDIRVALLGDYGAGKSTLLGVLAQGDLDDGHGKARLHSFRHEHEVRSGRTSSISLETVLLDKEGQIITNVKFGQITKDKESMKATKSLTFIDLAGSEKYQKTTYAGLMGRNPDFVGFIVSATSGLVGTAMYQLETSLLMKIPLFVVVTKIDICSKSNLAKTLQQIISGFKTRKEPVSTVLVQTEEEAVNLAKLVKTRDKIPIFLVSSVSGKNIEQLQKFLNALPTSNVENKELAKEPFEYQVGKVHTVPGVGSVVSGTVRKVTTAFLVCFQPYTFIEGTVNCGDSLWLGPDMNGDFKPIVIDSIHCNRQSYQKVFAGSTASFAICAENVALRTGQMILQDVELGKVCKGFIANVDLVTKWHVSCEDVKIYMGAARQLASVSIVGETTRDGSKKMKFQFLKHSEYVSLGTRFIFKNGTCTGVGCVLGLVAMKHFERGVKE